MKKTNKKGFTIVELVIVIAVIAILSAVLIPTFSGIVNKARMSTDQQAVRQMNTFLASEEEFENISLAKTQLLSADIDMNNYKPLAKGMNFYWIKSINRVVYTNSSNEIVFPEEYKDTAYKAGDWFSLSGEVTKKDYSVSNGSATLSDGGQFAKLMEDYTKGTQKPGKVELSDDVDLMGASANFSTINKALTLSGKTDDQGKPTTSVYGINSNTSVNDKKNAAGNASSYAYGLFGSIKNKDANNKLVVVIENLVIDGAVIDDPENPAQVGHAGILVGSITTEGTAEVEVTIRNIIIKNSYVRGEKKVGALIGYICGNVTVNISNVSVMDTVVTGGREVAALVGFYQKGTVSANVTKTNLEVKVDTSYGLTYNADNTIATYPAPSNQGSKAGVTTKDFWDARQGTSSTKTVATDFN